MTELFPTKSTEPSETEVTNLQPSETILNPSEKILVLLCNMTIKEFINSKFYELYGNPGQPDWGLAEARDRFRDPRVQ